MIKISTIAQHLDAMRNETIAATGASVDAMFENKDAFDTILDEIRSDRKNQSVKHGSPDPVVVSNPTRGEIDSYMNGGEPKHFRPVGKQDINGGTRYYEAKVGDSGHSQIRYIDVKTSGEITPPSDWFDVDRDDTDMFYVDDNGVRVNIGDIDYDDTIEKINISKESSSEPENIQAEDDESIVEIPEKVRRKAPKAVPPENSVAVWEPTFSVNVVDENGKSQFKSIKLPTIISDKKFPTRKLIDSIRILLNARVSVGMRGDRFTIIAKSKNIGDDYKSLAITYRNVVDKANLDSYLQEHNITPATPEQFIQELRKIL